MNVDITVTGYGQGAIQDILGLEAYAKPGSFTSHNVTFGITATFQVTGSTWTRLRPLLEDLVSRRIPAVDATGTPLFSGKTQPMISYTMDWVPGDRPRVHRVGTLPLSIAVPADLTLYGTNLLAGTAATSIVQSWSAVYSYGFPGTPTYSAPRNALKFTSQTKGRVGNKISYSIKPEGSASVTTTMNAEGDVHIEIVPATGASDSAAIAAQVVANPLAFTFVDCVNLLAPDTAPIAPTATQIGGFGPSPGGLTPSSSGLIGRVYLLGGDGGGLAQLDVLPAGVTDPSNRLTLVATKAGNQQNFITFTLLVGQAGNSVTVTGTNIVVSRILPNPTITAVEAAIDGNAAASALVTASTVGVGATTLSGVSKSWLHSGGGETPTVQIAGAVASVVSQTDTQMVVRTTNGALVTAGAVAGEEATVQVQMNYGLVTAPIGALAA
jgi:hypothetical protein